MSGAAAFFPDAVTPGVPEPSPPAPAQSSAGNNKANSDSGSRVRAPPTSNPDDWLCQQCSNINFARRMKCNRCQADKPFVANSSNKLPPGVLSAEVIAKSNGKYHEGDWSCSKCANVNWARRQSCNTCSAKKPGTGTDEGPREGRGGGFMERDERVSYKDSRYKDDESKYDDLGRLKKQFRAGAQGNAQTNSADGAATTDGNSKDDKSNPSRPTSESDSGARKNRSSRSRSRDRDPRDRDSPRHRSYRRSSRSRSRSRSPYDRRRYSDRPRRRSWSRSRSPPRRRPYSPRRSRSPPPRSRARSSRSRSRSNSRGRNRPRDRDHSRSRSRGRDRSPPRRRSRSRDRR